MANISGPDPKKKISGSKAKIIRNEKGDLYQKRDKDYAGVSGSTMQEDADVASAANESKTFSGAPAPRVGGSYTKTSPTAEGTSSRKLMNKSIKMTKRSAASPQAKRSALKLLKRQR